MVNLQALLNRLSRICLSRIGSAMSGPRLSAPSTTIRFLFFSASWEAVPITSSISRARMPRHDSGNPVESFFVCGRWSESGKRPKRTSGLR